MNIKTLIVTSLLCASATSFASTIAIVDMEKVSHNSEFGKMVVSKMETEEKNFEKKMAGDKAAYEETEAKIKKLESTINTVQKEIKDQEKVLTEQAKQAKIDKIMAAQEEGQILVSKLGRLERQLKEQARVLQQEFTEKYQQNMKELQEWASKAIDKVYEQNKFDLIMPAHVTLKFNKSLEITDKVITVLNKETEKIIKEYKEKNKSQASKASTKTPLVTQ